MKIQFNNKVKKDWNKKGILKAIVIIVLSLPNLCISVPLEIKFSYLGAVFIPLVFGSFGVPLIARINQGIKKEAISIPKWNDPLTGKNKLVLNQFGAFFFLGIGICMLIGQLMRFDHFNKLAIISMFFGMGILVGNYLTIQWFGSKNSIKI